MKFQDALLFLWIACAFGLPLLGLFWGWQDICRWEREDGRSGEEVMKGESVKPAQAKSLLGRLFSALERKP